MLAAGFRLFFLLAGAYAVIAGSAWFVWLGLQAVGAAVVDPGIAVEPHLWHGHEMMFGFGGAVVAGFFLTAVPNWTGTAPLHGRPLLALGLVWLAGRLAMWSSAVLPLSLVAVVDLLFLPLLAVVIWRALRRRPAARNLVVLAVVALLLLGNLLVHLHWLGLAEAGGSRGLAVALLALVLLITIIGGRIVPAFTRNALQRIDPEAPLPRSLPPLDAVSISGVLLLLLARAAEAPDDALAALAGLAALANAARLALWRGRATLGSPILWVLHLGYLWLVIGLALLAMAYLGALAESSALHGLGLGAVGTMTLAVMTRAALGHSGRPLVAPPGLVLAYLLVGLAAILRVVLPVVLPQLYLAWMVTASLAWIAAFGLFLVVLWPVLTGPAATAPGVAEAAAGRTGR